MKASEIAKSGKRAEIAKLVERGLSADETYVAIKPLVTEQIKPWVFNANVPGMGRQPKEIRAQYKDLRFEINRVFALFNRDGISPKFELDGMELPSEDDEIEREAERKAERAEKLPKGDAITQEKEYFLSEILRIRRWIANRAKTADTVDEMSMRPVIAATTAIPAGVPAKALLANYAMHWNQETRDAAGIPTFTEADYLKLSRDEMKRRGLDTGAYHKLAGLALMYAEARMPIMLVGPSGTGKSRLAKDVAKILGLDYGECPMTAGATPSWLLGSHTIKGFIPREFLEIYPKGGVFNYEEIDASDPNMLLVCNNALASDKLFNPMDGETYQRSPDFVAFSTANTFGLGANRMHSSRERLDAATIDRWRMGRIYLAIDEDLERRLLFA